MLQTLKRFKEKITPGAAVSAALHAGLLALLVFGLPDLTMEAEPPDVIQVQLVLSGEDAPDEEQQTAAPEVDEESEEQQTAAAGEPIEEPLRILRPVYQFGEEDTRAEEETEDGDALKDRQAAEALQSDLPLPEPDEPEQPGEALAATDVESAAAPDTEDEPLEPEETAETAVSSPDGESEVATTAIAGRPRGIRAGELCATELRRRLHGTVPPHRPDLIPAYRLDQGTVLQVRRGAFRTVTGWHNLRFRCEINEDATRIVSFEFEVGAPIPPAEWAGRGLPAT